MIIFSRIRFCILGLLLGGTLSALEVGEKLWEFGSYWDFSAPVLGPNGTVYVVSADNNVYALDGKSGAVKWQSSLSDYKFSDAFFLNKSIWIGFDDVVYVSNFLVTIALDSNTGQELWRMDRVNGTIYRFRFVPVDESGTILTIGYRVGSDNKMYAAHTSSISGRSGDQIWEVEFQQESLGSVATVVGSDGAIFTQYGTDPDAKLIAINGATGAKKWEFKTYKSFYQRGLAIGKDGIVFIFAEHKLFAINGETGVKKWELEHNMFLPMTDGGILVGNDGNIYITSGSGANSAFLSINAENGIINWSNETSPDDIVILEDGSLMSLVNDRIEIIDSKTGNSLWFKELSIGSTPVDTTSPSYVLGEDGTIYLSDTSENRVYAIKGPSGLATDAPWPMLGQNPQGTSKVPSSLAKGTGGTTVDNADTDSDPSDSQDNNPEPANITLPSWSWLETYPWIYNDGTWYYMKPVISGGVASNYLYNYTTQQWKLMGE